MRTYESELGPGLRPPVAEADDRVPIADETAFLQGLVRGMRCGVLIIDAEGRLVVLNELARRILGLAETPAAGTPLDAALPAEPRLVRILTGSFAMTSLPNRAELVLGEGSRGGKTIGFTLSLVRAADGGPCGAAMFFKDLTQIEHAEEQERLKERLAALGQMAASMAHEIRNPLASIDVSCKLLGRRVGGDDGCRELLNRIAAEVRRLNNTVDSSLRFVRPITLKLAPAELVPLLDEAVAAARRRRPAPGVEIRRRPRAEDIPAFLMDRERLRQVFVNLILNAVEAVGESGTITIEAERFDAAPDDSIPYEPCAAAGAADPREHAERFVDVRISDTGPGILEADRDRVFYPFFTTKEQGSGVGLALAKKIVDSHRGLIEVESPTEGGAAIRVRLPMIEEPAEVQAQ